MIPSEALRLKQILDAVQIGLGVLGAIGKLIAPTPEGRARRRVARLERDIEQAPKIYQRWQRRGKVSAAGYDWLMARLQLREVWHDPPSEEYLARVLGAANEEE